MVSGVTRSRGGETAIEWIAQRMRTPASYDEMEAAWAAHFRALDLPPRRVVWRDRPSQVALDRLPDILGDGDGGWWRLYQEFHQSAQLRRTDPLVQPHVQPRLKMLPGEFAHDIMVMERMPRLAHLQSLHLQSLWRWAHVLCGQVVSDVLMVGTAWPGWPPRGPVAEPWSHLLTAMRGALYAIVLRDRVVCLAAPRVSLDERGLFHSGTGPAISWEGEAYWFWHGVQVRRNAVLHPGRLTLGSVVGETNVEARRVMIERMTPERFVAGLRQIANELDRDTDRGGGRTLYALDIQVGRRREAWGILTVRCPSTGRLHLLNVPPGLRTCHEAAAWTFGYGSPSDYAPAAES